MNEFYHADIKVKSAVQKMEYHAKALLDNALVRSGELDNEGRQDFQIAEQLALQALNKAIEMHFENDQY